MLVRAVVENKTSSKDYKAKHGLCLYIEVAGHRILFDVGPDRLFLENAERMNIDISEIDTVIISHGHLDHGGGLRAFLENNSKAGIYIRKSGFEPHYIKVLGLPFYCGLDEKLIDCGRFVFTDEVSVIDDGLTLFSDVAGNMCLSKSNRSLYARNGKDLIADNFSHEQSLIISENGKSVLISGCSHSGIANIQQKAESIQGKRMDVVIGGFHLYNPPTGKYEKGELIDELGKKLADTGSRYYTCHCTGDKAYLRLKSVLGDRVDYLSTGKELKLDFAEEGRKI